MAVHAPPGRQQASRHISSDNNSSPGVSQDAIKAQIGYELEGVTWQIAPQLIAQALSSKRRKPTAPQFSADAIEHHEYYSFDVDSFDGPVAAAANLIPLPHLASAGQAERNHYPALSLFLNECVTSARTIVKDRVHYLEGFNFIIWDKPTNDGVAGSNPVKPDLAGGAFRLVPNELYWRPPNPDKPRLDVPLEVKDRWADLVRQAGTYARCLFSAAPLRQYALVLGFNQKLCELRFLVFHRGGLTASTPLSPTNPLHIKEILRLFVAMMTWKSRGDAGLPAWSNDTAMILPLGSGIAVQVDEVIHESTCVRGRAPRVSRVSSGIAPLPPVVPLRPQTQTGLVPRRSPRLTTKTTARTEPVPRGRRRGDINLRLMSTPNLQDPQHSDPSQEPISIYSNGDCVQFIKPAITVFENSLDVLPNGSIIKTSWVSKATAAVEASLLRDCSGMFGTPRHYGSFIPSHEAEVPVTNHLFIPSNVDAFWNIFTAFQGTPEPDYRILWAHISSFVGRSLVGADSIEALVMAVTHAIIGYRNMVQSGYQHRDASIGNILWTETPITTLPAFSPADPLFDLAKKLGISDTCTGFFIDGDMAIRWADYFGTKRVGTRSGTFEFMSDAVREARLFARHHLQTPIDDMYCIYFVAQWAAVFHESSFHDSSVPPELQRWRSLIGGDLSGRDSVTLKVTNALPLESAYYGKFLTECQPFLRQWKALLDEANVEWTERSKRVDDGELEEHFKSMTDQILTSFLELVSKQLGPRTVQ